MHSVNRFWWKLWQFLCSTGILASDLTRWPHSASASGPPGAAPAGFGSPAPGGAGGQKCPLGTCYGYDWMIGLVDFSFVVVGGWFSMTRVGLNLPSSAQFSAQLVSDFLAYKTCTIGCNAMVPSPPGKLKSSSKLSFHCNVIYWYGCMYIIYRICSHIYK